jgi:uncharacterized protein
VIQRALRRTLPDGARLQADVLVPEGPPPLSAVVLVHGFKGFKDWGFFPATADALARDGHAVVSFNFSLNGIGSRPAEFTDLDAFSRNTFTRELDELLQVLEAVREPGILSTPPRRIGLLGHSRGGGDAVLAAAESGVDALVTWAAVATFDRWGEETKAEWRKAGRITVMNQRTGQEMPLGVTLLEDFEANRDRLDIEAAAARVTAPWLILHGKEDESVAPEDAHRLARAASPSSARLHLVDGAGHTFGATHPFRGETPELEEVLALTRAHFRDHLAGGGS